MVSPVFPFDPIFTPFLVKCISTSRAKCINKFSTSICDLQTPLCEIIVSPRHYTVDPMLSASGNLFKYHEEVLYLQPLIPPKRFDIFSP